MASPNPPLLSLVIPVHNTGPYLAPCLESALGQDFSDMEVIAVNDGSTDGSGAVLDAFARRHPRLRAVHTGNRGVSAARNTGLELARGEWILFLDSDDLLEPDACSTLLALAADHRADAVMFEYQADFEDGSVMKHRFSKPGHYGLLDRRQAMRAVYGGACFLWAALYSRRILEGVRCREDIHRGEDTIFKIEAFNSAERVFSTDRILYHYVQSRGSAARGGITARQLTGIEALKWMLDFADANFPELHALGVDGYMNILVEFYYDMQVCQYRDPVRERQICSEARKYLFEALASPEISLKQKVKFLLFGISRRLFLAVLTAKRHGKCG